MALDHLGYTCYLMGNRYEPSRTLIQVTGCLRHSAFCQAIGNACERLAHIPQIRATKLQNNADGWGRYGDMVCGRSIFWLDPFSSKRNPVHLDHVLIHFVHL